MAMFGRAADLAKAARGAFEIVVLVCVMLASLLMIRALWLKQSQPRPAANVSPTLAVPKRPISTVGSPIEGATTAPVGMIIYSDFQCPFCASFGRDTLPKLRQKFVESGRLAVVYKHLALGRIHPFAVDAATVGVCVARGGRFWQWHDALFSFSGVWTSSTAEFVAIGIGENQSALRSCLRDPGPRQRVEQDISEASQLGIKGTPTFFLGRRNGDEVQVASALSGARPLAEFEAAIDEILGRR